MNFLFVTLLTFALTPLKWSGNFEEAQKDAKSSHKLILVNFSGSDWCGPCIRLRKEVLESEAFESYAKDHLDLVRADFPRQKKNQLAPAQVKLNEALAERYDKQGKFPYTLLVDENGKVLKAWDGYPKNITAESFVKELAALETKH